MEKKSNPLAAPSNIESLSTIAERYDLILCDVWGVVHDGERALPEAVTALKRFRAKGGIVALITNAPRPREGLIPLLDQFGVERPAYDAVVSSGDVTVELMGARTSQKVFHLGPARDSLIFETYRKRFEELDPRVSVEEAHYCVCTGLWRDDDNPADYVPLLKTMLAKNLPMICANPDIVVHVGASLMFCAGALARNYAAMGGMVEQAGKPFEALYALARTLVPSAKDIDNRRILAIGDAFATDMRGAGGQGVDALFISGGIHRGALYTPEWNEGAYKALCDEYALCPFGRMTALKW